MFIITAFAQHHELLLDVLQHSVHQELQHFKHGSSCASSPIQAETLGSFVITNPSRDTWILFGNGIPILFWRPWGGLRRLPSGPPRIHFLESLQPIGRMGIPIVFWRPWGALEVPFLKFVGPPRIPFVESLQPVGRRGIPIIFWKPCRPLEAPFLKSAKAGMQAMDLNI